MSALNTAANVVGAPWARDRIAVPRLRKLGRGFFPLRCVRMPMRCSSKRGLKMRFRFCPLPQRSFPVCPAWDMLQCCLSNWQNVGVAPKYHPLKIVLSKGLLGWSVGWGWELYMFLGVPSIISSNLGLQSELLFWPEILAGEPGEDVSCRAIYLEVLCLISFKDRTPSAKGALIGSRLLALSLRGPLGEAVSLT